MTTPDPSARASAGTMPSIFLAHGSPLLLDDGQWVTELQQWSANLPRPKAVLMISAHWERSPITLGATSTVPLVYDFYGFPPQYYEVTYPAPGAPDLARRVRELLSGRANGGPVAESPQRGLDHGAYVPMVAMYPQADVPVLQMSIPTMDPAALLALGRALAPLRDEGVLLVGSGFITHNLRAASLSGKATAPPSWASEFDAWTREVVERRDVDALVDYRTRAPGVAQSLPTHEHFVPLVVTMGSSIDRTERVSFPVTGFTYGSMTKRSVQAG
jgi:4,5-DOPA dioxygenase extradiol